MIFTGSEAARQMDRYAIDTLGIPGELLMERAAAGAAAEIRRMLPAGGRVLVLSGSGNNGGDGIGIAAMLRETGFEVRCVMAGDPEKLSHDSRCMLARLEAAGEVLHPFETVDSLGTGWDLMVDALLGTGLSREVGGKYRAIIDYVNSSGIPVLACDIPSGISADTGAVLGTAVKASVTVTFHRPKTGHLLPPGTEHTGRLVVHDIGIPPEATARGEKAGQYVTGDMVKRWLPPLPLESHKGSCGKLLLLCGSVGFTGAAALAAQAALRTGAGLVYLGVPEPVYPILAAKVTEPVVFPLPARDGRLSEEAIPEILRRLPDMDAALLGPGLGAGEAVRAVTEAVLAAASCPAVLDADGINVLSGHIDILGRAAGPVVLTPHPGEFRRLGGDGSLSRIAGAKDLAVRLGATVVLKGYRTVTASREGEIYVNSTGNPGMATGGSGDVLSGILTALLGFGMDPVRAAAAAVWLHGAAGDRAAETLGRRSLLPTDMLGALPQIIREITEE